MKKKYLVVALACLTSMCFAEKIGVLKADKNFKCPNKEITIDLDVEDSNNKTGVKNKTDPNPPGISLGGHAKFTYCVLDVNELPKVPYDYIVLRMDENCPAGASRVARHHDTEDSNNKNSPKNSKEIWPSVINNNATLEYCFVPATRGSKNKFPSFDKKNGHKYGVFANKTGTNIAHSEIYIDDEDDRNTEWHCHMDWYENWRNWGGHCGFEGDYNSNGWIYGFNDPDREKRVAQIMSGTNNTTYHTIRWTANSTSGMLAKSADAGVIDAPMAATKPVAASIRGLDRSIISVELKTAGNANVSVMNINGAVIAKVTEENLQAGIHNLKWNSDIVPNGLYIVTVEHNGMISSMRILLK